MKLMGLKFGDAVKAVLRLAGIRTDAPLPAAVSRPVPVEEPPARPTQRVMALLREACPVADCEPARLYLASRGLWPLPAGTLLRAHPSVDYWQEGERLGQWPALVASVRDINGQVVTAHVTYLERDGRKLTTQVARKIMSGMHRREGCACRLMSLDGDTLGVAEGIETALSAAAIHNIRVWACLNTSLLLKFEPPTEVKRIVIFADRDIAGLDAAGKLMQRLQGRVHFELRLPRAGDWNDVLMEKA